MTIEEALAVVEVILGNKSLTDIQEKVFRGCWAEKSYPEIAENTVYSGEHIKFVGFKLWGILSQKFGERVTKSNVHSVIRRQQQKIYAERGAQAQLRSGFIVENPTHKVASYFQDWGEAIESQIFYGRDREIEQLTNWIKSDRCRLVGILGMGGMGKTSLSIKVAELVKDEFQFTIWRSLRNAPPPEAVIAEILQFVSRQQELDTATSLEEKITKLVDYLRSSRCLIIIDNLESVLQDKDRSGRYLPGYEAYGQLIGSVSEIHHQSCLIFTSREQPVGIESQEGETPNRLFKLTGLSVPAVKELFSIKGEFIASDTEWMSLVKHYGGNPLALKMSASILQDIAGGNISQALPLLPNFFIFDDILDLLERQFNRLSNTEKIAMYWLAIWGEPVEFSQISENAVYQTDRADLFQATISLQRRSLIDKASFSASGRTILTYFQQPVIGEYLLKKLVEETSQEIVTGEVDLLISHCLMQAQTKEYLRDAQSRFILEPLCNRLLAHFKSTKSLIKQIKKILTKLRRDRDRMMGYAPGNIINILKHLKVDLTDWNFSDLNVWQAYLADTHLHGVNFANADLSMSIFSETLDSVWSVAFSADGQRLATGDLSCNVRIWQVKDAKQEYVFKGHSAWVTGVCFHPHQPIIASCSGDKTIKLWDLETTQCFKTLEGHQGWIAAIDFSRDGKNLVSCGVDRQVRIWDVDSGNCLHILEGHADWVRAVVFSPDGRLIASGSNDCTVKIWNHTGQCLATLEGHTEQVRALTFTSNSMLASGSNDRSIRLWDLNTYQCTHTFWGHTSHVRSLSCDTTGKLVASGGEDRTIRIWDLELKKCWKVFPGQESQVWSVAFSPMEATLASGTLDRKLRLWDVEAGKCMKTWQGQMNSFWSIAYSSDGKTLAAGCADGSVKIWDLATRRCIKKLSGHGHWVWCVAFSPVVGNRPQKKLLASSSFDRTVRIWNSQTGQCLFSLQGHNTYVHAVSFSPDAQYLASGSADGTVKLWDVNSGQCLRTWTEAKGAVWSVAFSPNSDLLLIGDDSGTIGLWDIRNGELYQTWQQHATRVRCLSVGATKVGNSWLVASASDDGTAKVWDLYKGICLQTLNVDTNQVLSVAFSPDCQQIVTASDRPPIAKIWDLNTSSCLKVLEGHNNCVYSALYAPNGSAIATGSQDGSIGIWHPETGELLHNLEAIEPYAGMNIRETTGLSAAQRSNLIDLGAID